MTGITKMKKFLLHSLIGNILILLFIVFVILTFSYVKGIYDRQYIWESKFYACPENETSKCYKIRVDFGGYDCDEVHCNDPVPNKLQFDNGGYVDVSCIQVEKEKWFCNEEKTNKNWNIQFAETTKVKK
jgi:hypothetical protein